MMSNGDIMLGSIKIRDRVIINIMNISIYLKVFPLFSMFSIVLDFIIFQYSYIGFVIETYIITLLQVKST
ncbi:hypothetical protein MNBD_GAMMA01-1731 [hydrothermal vent metagenome]|uniref:Uncharacterized protein n=1 Tax=hydrothermal vent metagenome TaxID=652676 RepID=A0A3B0VHM5_9ZZZZ